MAGENVISFQCPRCASPIVVHAAGQSLSFGCQACGAVVEENNQGRRILQKHSQAMQWKPLLELGSKAKFRGETWQVLGFLVRSDEASDYTWSEYLLFNPYQGFRWLMEAEGHWNYILMTRHRPSPSWNNGMHWGNRSYRLYFKGRARVKFVLGEFYWRVRVDDVVGVTDYIAPPEILSSEVDGGEEMWSAGTYVEPGDIEKSFKLTGPMPERRGIAPNQPSRYTPHLQPTIITALLFIGLLVIFQGLTGCGEQATVLDQDLFRRGGNAVEILRSESFTLDRDNSHITIKLSEQMPAPWMYLRTTLVGEDGQLPTPLEFGRELGTEDDEGYPSGAAEDAFLNHLGKGRYHLEIVSEADGQQDARISIRIVTGEMLMGPFVLCLILIVLYPLGLVILSSRFETDRWANSDQGG